MTKIAAPTSNIQFISAEEMRRAAEMDKEERKLRTVEGMLDQMDEIHQAIDQASEIPLMAQWAIKDPGQFFGLMAKLKMHNKGAQNTTRIQIGLPMTALDGPHDESE